MQYVLENVYQGNITCYLNIHEEEKEQRIRYDPVFVVKAGAFFILKSVETVNRKGGI